MGSEPLVSVIIPIYNGEKYIAETLNSLIKQEYSNVEVIVIDNASSDGSIAIVESYSDSLDVRVIKCVENSGGPAKPRNIGIENSSGEYIAFLDADDTWHPKKLSYQVKLMLTKQLNFSCVSPLFINEGSEVIKRIRGVSVNAKDRKYGVKSLLFRNTITTSSVLIKRAFLGEERFNESELLVCSEDYHLWLTLLNKKNISFLHIKNRLVNYRVVSSSLGNSNSSYLFAVKGMFASTIFLIESKAHRLMFIVLLSNMLRLLKLYLCRRA